ncbi:DUF3108 domain-containing protein [Thiobacillus sp.]|uniref:DUF3108 domain-containing protein n=1 Tax=Thiobacillus sp. TaxID=924 RepID=UPI0025D84F77|nr:DUF3108 domain-containing protein [Thiobacillus sp.]
MGRRVRPWWLALAASLLLHGALIGALGWRLPQWQPPAEPPLFEARLLAKPRLAVAAAPPLPAPPVARARPVHAAPPPELPVEEESEAETEAAEAAAVAATDSSAAPAVRLDEAPAAAPAEAPSAAAETAPPALNPLPPRLDLHFRVHYGVASGEQTLLWVNEGERYTLTSVAAASGLAGVFYRGRFVQTSRGRITPHGLQPEEFWDQRGDKRSRAHFDAANGSLTLIPAQGAPRHFAYQGEVQDALSLFFQLALTAPPPPDGRLTYAVFNGKKLRDYSYAVRGEEILQTALGELRTLHLVRVADADGRFEAWLAIDRHYLPVRVLRSDEKGGTVELRVKSIDP